MAEEAAACKWCEKGECWTHGQIEKPAGYKGGKRKGGGKGGAKGGKAQMMKGKMGKMQMMMQMWGMPGAGGETQNIKGQLSTAYARACRGMEKGEITYETSAVDEQQGKYQSTVTIAENTYTGEIANGKKAAEHAAAKAAMDEMYPDEASEGGGEWSMPPMFKQYLSTMMGKGGGGEEASSGKKRSHEEAAVVVPKSRLVHALALMLGRSGTKEDMTWTVEPADGQFVGSVTLTTMDKTFTGEPAASRKAAENAAAEVALEALSEQIETLEEEHKAKKAKKNQENLAALKLRMDEKKAAKALAKAEAA